MKFAKVVVDLKNDQLNNSYDYSIPEQLEDFINVGSRVSVSFGLQEIMGYVIKITDSSPYGANAKPIKDCLDYDQELTEEQVELALYISKIMHVTVISVLELMIPSFLKGQKRKFIVVKDYYKLHPDLALLFNGKERLSIDEEIKDKFDLVKKEIEKGNITIDYDYYTYGRDKKITEYYINDAFTDFRSMKRKAIYDYVSIHPGTTIDIIANFVNCSYSLVKDMVKEKSLFTKEKSSLSQSLKQNEPKFIQEDKIPIHNNCDYDFTLDEESTILKYFQSQNQLFLLHSNHENFKAAFYCRIIEDCKRKNQQVLITCPTIILQEEILMYLKRSLEGYNIYGITSKNTKAEKYDAYMNIKYNQCDCLVTTHNGIFLPFNNLGAVIVVDEGNLNYNCENYPYYRACDVLEFRANYHHSKILYVSSSPSIYNYHRVEEGKLKLLECFLNTNNYKRVINMKNAIMNGESEVISNYLRVRMNEVLKKPNAQVMLLVNSKAYSNALICDSCGKILKCPNCNIPLTYYKDKNVVRCNYCDHKIDKLENVTKCNCGGAYHPFGFGQEKVNEVVKEMFPDKRVLNINADLMKKIDDYNKALIDIEENKVDIIIGTNIVTKSINADNIVLVGLVDFDSYLLSHSHRANEMSYNYVDKLSNKNEVIIQAYSVDSEILKLIMSHDYESYYRKEIEMRKQLGYEPFNEVNRITVTGEFKDIYYFANYFKKVFKGIFRNVNDKQINVLGPTYDYHVRGIKLIVKHNNYDQIIALLEKTMDNFKNVRINLSFERYPKVL